MVTIVAASITPYSLPFLQPLPNASSPQKCRQGAILCLTASDNSVGKGEIAPLPGLHNQSLVASLVPAEQLTKALIGTKAPSSRIEIAVIVASFRLPAEASLVELALEMALFDLLESSPSHWIKQNKTPIMLNALIMLDDPNYLDKTHLLLKSGYRSIKVKIGRVTVNTAIAGIRSIQVLIDEMTSLRLDVNQAWTLAEAITLGTGIDPSSIEYIEEPCTSMQDLQRFYEATGIPIALDESLRLSPVPDLSDAAFIKTLILKPSLLGGFGATETWIAAALSHQRQAVVSSTFESATGLRAYARLTLRNQLTNTAHGLDTWRWLYPTVPAELPLVNNSLIFD